MYLYINIRVFFQVKQQVALPSNVSPPLQSARICIKLVWSRSINTEAKWKVRSTSTAIFSTFIELHFYEDQSFGRTKKAHCGFWLSLKVTLIWEARIRYIVLFYKHTSMRTHTYTYMQTDAKVYIANLTHEQ